MRKWILALIAFLTVLVAGCSSTKEHRVGWDPMWHTYPGNHDEPTPIEHW